MSEVRKAALCFFPKSAAIVRLSSRSRWFHISSTERVEIRDRFLLQRADPMNVGMSIRETKTRRNTQQMPRNYRTERDAVVRRWYGGHTHTPNPRRQRSWEAGPVTATDCFAVPTPVNSPYRLSGHCMVWRYSVDRDGYGSATIDGKRVSAHRAAFIQSRGEIPEGKQINHLCNRPYCIQPSHLYAGTKQDNKDDSQIFSKTELIFAPAFLDQPAGAEPEDPLLERLASSNRYDGMPPWEPVPQPAQRPMDEFSCPGHDFAIPMFGGESEICRICETSRFEDSTLDELSAPRLIAELCPASQTVAPIFEKVSASAFAGQSRREDRRRSCERMRNGFGSGGHDIRSCGCVYCDRDRNVFRDSVHPQLTKREAAILDMCDLLRPRIDAALADAAEAMADVWAASEGLNGRQARAMRRHVRDCANTRSEFKRASRTLESELAYLADSVAEFDNLESMGEDRTFKRLISGWRSLRIRKEDRRSVSHAVLPVAMNAAELISRAWDDASHAMVRPHVESKPDLVCGIRRLVSITASKHVMEHLRHELLGRNTFSEREPHPHLGCLDSIRETGRAPIFTVEFEEGKGYSPPSRRSRTLTPR